MNRSRPFARLPGREGFIWAAGIEDTFVAARHPVTGRILDEYALTEHYERWEDDLRLLAELGVTHARYGIPWYRVNPSPGVYRWDWTDRVLDRLVNTHQIEPIVDLVHYGTPTWMERAFLDPDYPARVAEYAHAFAERYRPLCRWYTPLNEPRVNAWYAGRLGWWPPYGRSPRSYLDVLTAITRGICLTQRAVADVDPEAIFVHVDASDLYVPSDPADPQLVDAAGQWQERVYLSLDLAMGRVDSNHACWHWMSGLGFLERDLEWFKANAVRPDVIGFNMYPMYSRKIVGRAGSGIRVRIHRCWTETLDEISRQYSSRYDIPLMITETACGGSFRKRIAWVDESVEVVRGLRRDGVNLVGYTFWPLFSIVAWAYRNSTRDISDYLFDIGLWDLEPGPTGLERVHTPVVDAFQKVVRSTPETAVLK